MWRILSRVVSMDSTRLTEWCLSMIIIKRVKPGVQISKHNWDKSILRPVSRVNLLNFASDKLVK